jgi:hypothetical protein
MENRFYGLMTAGSGLFLLTGILLGLSSTIGLWYVEALGIWQVEVARSISAILMMVAISSFMIGPTLGAAFSLYLGYDIEDRAISVISASFTTFTGYFIMNLTAITILLNQVEASSGMNSPYRILNAFIGLENSVALFSFPTLLVSMFAAYLGSQLRE